MDLHTLLERNPYLKQVLNNIEQVMWIRDLTTDQVVYVSPAFEIIWGRSCDSLYANTTILMESVHPEDRVQVLAAQPRNDYRPFNQVYRIFRPDDTIRWVYTRTFVFRSEESDPFWEFCIAQDITDQKQAELAQRKTLDRSREQFKLSHKMNLARKPEAVLRTLMSCHELRFAHHAALLFNNNPKVGSASGVEITATWQASQTHPLWLGESNLYEDPAFVNLFQQHQTLIISDIRSDPHLPPIVRDSLLEGGTKSLIVFPLITAGSWLGNLVVYYENETQFNHFELGHIKVLIGQATITLNNLRLLEVAEESRHEAERANEIKTEFLAMISHELRTPLTSIIGFTTTLLAEDVSWEPAEQYDFIQTIQHEANRLQELIDHLLVLSRLEAGMLPIMLKPHSLQEIFQDAAPQLQTLTKDQVLNVHLPGNLPLVLVDTKRIAQVLVNLVRNASTYAPKGSEINISAGIRGGFVQINVNDQGPGIPHVDHRKVFKAFHRGQNEENGTTKGAGLGLAICKGLVENHGGRIWIKKKNSPGASISFTIPLVSNNSLNVGLQKDQ